MTPTPEQMAEEWFYNSAVDRDDLHVAYLAGYHSRDAEVESLRQAIREAAKLLDGIKFELSASVYTLEDDEFETVFFVRDVLTAVLEVEK